MKNLYKNKKDIENMKEFLTLLKSEKFKMIIALSCDKNTLERIEKLEKTEDELDTKIYNILVGYFSGKKLYNNFSLISNFIGNDEYKDSFYGLTNVINNLKTIGSVFNFDNNINDMIGFIGESNIINLKKLLNDRKKVEDEKKSIINNCITRYENVLQSEEMQDFQNKIIEIMGYNSILSDNEKQQLEKLF